MAQLRELRASKIDTIRALRGGAGMSLVDGKRLVHFSATWADVKERGGSEKYALGFNVTAGPPLMVGHGGGAPGINAEIALFPDSRWKVITLSNQDPPAASQLAALLERVLFASDEAAACSAALNERAFPPHRARGASSSDRRPSSRG